MTSSLTVTRSPEPPEAWAPLARQIGTFYHDPRWIRGVAQCFGYRLHCLTASRAGQVVGALALAEVPSVLGAPRLSSFPFSFIAGPMAQSPEVSQSLCRAALELAMERRVRRLEIKRLGKEEPPPPEFTRSSRYATYRISTVGGEAAAWRRLHVTSTQQRIRKAQKAGVVVVDGDSEADWLAMARLEERVQQRHGVPPPPRRFFLDLCRRLQREGLVDLYLARIPGGRLAGGFVMYKGPREWIYALSASEPELVKEYRATHLLLWTGLQRAIAAGVVVDLGRTAPEQASLAEFKLRWGAETVPLAYDYWPDAGGMDHLRRDRGPLALAARVWSGLPPSIARLGAGLYRFLG